jgi:hypothetical protein
LTDNRKAFEFIFGGGLDYSKDFLERGSGLGSLMMNISHYGIQGGSKSGADAGQVVDHMTSQIYAPHYGIIKKGPKYTITYVRAYDSNLQFAEREANQKAMQANSGWFFQIMALFHPRLYVVFVPENRGASVGSVKKVSEIKPRLDWYKNSEHGAKDKDSVYIRVKKNTSSINLYEIFPEWWEQFRRDLDALKIEYKVL